MESPLAKKAAVYPFVIYGDFKDFLVHSISYFTVFLLPVDFE